MTWYKIKKRALADIDPEIRALIVSLNEKGYGTLMSCAGHGPRERGYILCDRAKGETLTKRGLRKDEAGEIKAILKQFGCKNIRITSKDFCANITFTAMGKTGGSR